MISCLITVEALIKNNLSRGVMHEKVSGIYEIRNLVNGKTYVGQSINIKSRKSVHLVNLRYNRHHSKHLQNAWNKYGESNFEFGILEECSIEKLTEREQHWIDTKKAYHDEFGYNIGKCAEPSSRGLKRSAETINKMKEARRNSEKVKEVNRRKIGTHDSPETIEKRREAVINSEKWKESMKKMIGEGNPFFGKNHTAKTKSIISEKKLGVLLVPRETRECECKCGETFEVIVTSKKRYIEGHENRGRCGRKHTEKTLEKMRKAHSGENNAMFGKVPALKGKKLYHIPFQGSVFL